MTPQDFDTILASRLDTIKAVLSSKAGEYAQEGDRLFNFKQAAKINNTTAEKALWGMATKHLISVIDLVDGRLVASSEMVDEKCLDLINYLLLLIAIFAERREII